MHAMSHGIIISANTCYVNLPIARENREAEISARGKEKERHMSTSAHNKRVAVIKPLRAVHGPPETRVASLVIFRRVFVSGMRNASDVILGHSCSSSFVLVRSPSTSRFLTRLRSFLFIFVRPFSC
jgi:hypothetical protein